MSKNSQKPTQSTGKTGSPRKTAAKKSSLEKKSTEPTSAMPQMVYEASAASTSGGTRSRRNVAGTMQRTDKFKNIEEGLVPFNYSKGTLNLDVKKAVELCQQAYYNFAVFRNAIDLMAELSISPIHLQGGTKKSRDFFEAFFKKVNLWCFQDKFFREYYRSGNVFVYKFVKNISREKAKKIIQVYGGKKVSLPIKYIILNPADIQIGGNISFALGAKYFKLLNPYEIARLKDPKTEEDKEILDSMDPESKKKLKAGSTSVLVALDDEKIHPIFYKKQDYEPFGIPMGYPVLSDINWKAEMKKMDMAITRTLQQVILLVTMGAEPEKGGINQKNLNAMTSLFENQSVGRVLVADYTTKAEFVIPKIADLLDPRKYEVVDRDIQSGLNILFFSGSGEKFANQSAKIEVFIARLNQARKAFIQDFLMPEIKSMSKELGFKSFPTPVFEKINLKDEYNTQRIYTRLVELGVLTPEEGIEALESGRLPNKEESLESQEDYKGLRDKGLYEPVMGGPETQKKMQTENMDVQKEMQDVSVRSAEKINQVKVNQKPKTSTPAQKSKKVSKDSGRPAGTTNQKTSAPVNAGEQYSLAQVKDNLILAQKLTTEVEASLRKKHSKRKLGKQQKAVAEQIAELIIANEIPADWSAKIDVYLENPIDHNPDRVEKIQDVAYQHQVDPYLASILHASEIKT